LRIFFSRPFHHPVLSAAVCHETYHYCRLSNRLPFAAPYYNTIYIGPHYLGEGGGSGSGSIGTFFFSVDIYRGSGAFSCFFRPAKVNTTDGIRMPPGPKKYINHERLACDGGRIYALTKGVLDE